MHEYGNWISREIMDLESKIRLLERRIVELEERDRSKMVRKIDKENVNKV